LKEATASAARTLEGVVAQRSEDLGEAKFDALVRTVQLTVLDQQWAAHLARVRFIRRHPNLFGVGRDVVDRQDDEIHALSLACRQRMREYMIGYIVSAEP
jgi:preprotein translocase subunit SecA